jgi:hypothetical protein
VDHLARSGPLITAHRLGRVQVAYPVQSQPPQDAADGGRGNVLARQSGWESRDNLDENAPLLG